MNDTASIYKQTGQTDKWGQPTTEPSYTGNCMISYNTDLSTIFEVNGVMTTMSASIIFRGFVDTENGDYVEFTIATGVTKRYQIIDVFFYRDYAGKILHTRVVVGNGNRS